MSLKFDPVREIIFRGVPAIVMEILPDEWPSGYRWYGIRHTDNDWDDPATIEPRVLVNRWGWLGIKAPVELVFGSNGYIALTEEERNLIRGGE